jgi:protein-tyrosine phosphatase
MNLINGKMPFKLGRLDTVVVGGPFRNFEEFSDLHPAVGVLMAEELAHLDHTIFVPTRDFSTPRVKDFRRGLMMGLAQIAQGRMIYVGCMGGIGRTGLYLAGLAKIMGAKDPVGYVRSHYLPSAVETTDQQAFIADLEVELFRKWAQFL